jgi:hypothetical protein
VDGGDVLRVRDELELGRIHCVRAPIARRPDEVVRAGTVPYVGPLLNTEIRDRRSRSRQQDHIRACVAKLALDLGGFLGRQVHAGNPPW